MNKLLQLSRAFLQASIAILIVFIGPDLSAQTDATDPQTICIGSIEFYQVDYLENGGQGTTGSTYTWSITSGAFAGTLTPNQGPSGSTNRIQIDWGASPAGPYVLEVVETANGCPGAPIILNIILTPEVIPTFDAIGPLCQNSTPPTLPTSSTNSPAITGTWNAAISTASPGTTVYTFTPDPDQCATTTTLNIEVTPEVTPTFATIGPLCENSSAPSLPATSIEGITGTWSPAAISTTATGTTTYTFTPDNPNQCAIPATLDIEVTPEVTPTFTAIGPLCENSSAPSLPATSIEGITGTWSPAAISTTTTGTTTYTFTPDDPLQCAIPATLDILINPLPVISVSDETICEGEATTLTASGADTYSWDPPAGLSATTGASVDANPVTTTIYTVTGTDANGCENSASATVTVNPLPVTSTIFHD